jgi:hypothetical protein
MSTTTPPPAPKKTPEQALDDMLNKVFPPGQFVPLPISQNEFERTMEDSWKHLPLWFHFEKVNGVLRPRSFNDKLNLLAALEKI